MSVVSWHIQVQNIKKMSNIKVLLHLNMVKLKTSLNCALYQLKAGMNQSNHMAGRELNDEA